MGVIASEITGIPWSCTANRVDIVLDNLLAVKIDHAAFFRFMPSRQTPKQIRPRRPAGTWPKIFVAGSRVTWMRML